MSDSDTVLVTRRTSWSKSACLPALHLARRRVAGITSQGTQYSQRTRYSCLVRLHHQLSLYLLLPAPFDQGRVSCALQGGEACRDVTRTSSDPGRLRTFQHEIERSTYPGALADYLSKYSLSMILGARGSRSNAFPAYDSTCRRSKLLRFPCSSHGTLALQPPCTAMCLVLQHRSRQIGMGEG